MKPCYRLLFFLHARNFDRLFECTLRALLESGHRIHVAFDLEKSRAEPSLFDTLGQEFEQLSCGRAPVRTRARWYQVARQLRLGMDYLRYLEPAYADAAALRSRAQARAPWMVSALASIWPLRSARGRRALAAALRAFELAVPADPEIDRFITTFAPDVVVVSPLVSLGSMQGDYVRAARRKGIRSALLVASWDNLTNKGRVREVPDTTIVWNASQALEAMELHGIDADRISVVGAHTYDHWFSWGPSSSREEFCRRLGLDSARPLVLYVCSSHFIAGDREPALVERWLRALRDAPNPLLREAGVLVRPHPQNARGWARADLSHFGNVAIWPRGGATPVDEARKAEYYDSIYHCSAVVGLNTSALVESAIVGRPVLTIVTDDFRSTQEGTLHFGHLTGVQGDGVLTVARTFEEHLAQLAGALEDPPRSKPRLDRFVRRFVRPGGLELAAAGLAVERLEALAASPSLEPKRRSWHPTLRPVLVLLIVPALALGRLLGRGHEPDPIASELARERTARPGGRWLVVAGFPGQRAVRDLQEAGFSVALAVPSGTGERQVTAESVQAFPISVDKGWLAQVGAGLEGLATRRLNQLAAAPLRLLAASAPVDRQLLGRLQVIEPEQVIVVSPLQLTADREITRAAQRLGIRVLRVSSEQLSPIQVADALARPRPRSRSAPLRLALQSVLGLLALALYLRRAVRLRTRTSKLIGRLR